MILEVLTGDGAYQRVVATVESTPDGFIASGPGAGAALSTADSSRRMLAAKLGQYDAKLNLVGILPSPEDALRHWLTLSPHRTREKLAQ